MEIVNIAKKYNQLLSAEQKRRLVLLFLLISLAAVMEIFSVSVMFPFVLTIMNADIESSYVLSQVCGMLHIQTQKELILTFIGAIITIFLLKDLFMIIQVRIQANFVFKSRLETQNKLLHAYLCKPYVFFLTAQSGEVLRVIQNDVQQVYNLLMTLLSFLSDSIITVAIFFTLLLIDPLTTLIVSALLAIVITAIILVIRPVLHREGEEFRRNRSIANKWILQSVHGIKEIKVADNEGFFEASFDATGSRQIESERRYTIISATPRMFIEMGCVTAVLIAVAFMLLEGRGTDHLIAVLGTFAMAASKLMPAANRVVSAMSQISYHGPAIDNVLNCIREAEQQKDRQAEAAGTIALDEQAELQDIYFSYPNSKEQIFAGANLRVQVGQCVGIIGTSGAGKTTAVDILLGLLSPSSGRVLADGMDIQADYKGWLKKIGYIPQAIFMMNDTIAANIAFGNKLDEDKLWSALKEVQLEEFVKRLPEGIQTPIGERGIRLSGGQRQRIGIARALYNDPALLVFDEATSALDEETESAILESINALHGKKTMIIIAHRMKTIEHCDVVYRVKDGEIIETQ